MRDKLANRAFLADVRPLLSADDAEQFDAEGARAAFHIVLKVFIKRLPGKAWAETKETAERVGMKPDDTAVERRSISASRNALAINVILKAAMASPPQIARASCTSSSIALAAVGEGFVRAGSDTGIP